MRTLAILVGMGWSLFAMHAIGQDLQQPRSTQPDSFAYNSYYQEAQPSPSDLPIESQSSDEFSKERAGKNLGKGGKGRRSSGWLGDRWTMDGFIDLGGTVNADNPANRFNGPMTFNDRNDFTMNQLYLSLGREVDNGGCGFDWGARIDFLYGTDYIFTQSVGLETKDNGDNAWNGLTTGLGNPNLYGLAMPQAYVDLAYNRLNFRLGHFYTIMGYEGVAANKNFFYSHAYTMQYAEPFTHTGGLMTWSGDRWTVHGGLVNGWDKTDAESDKLAFLGGITYTPCHERYSITLTGISGEEDGTLAATVTPTPRNMYSLVMNYHVTDRLEYVLQHDNSWQEDVFGPGVDAEWYGLNHYLFYTLNDCWKFGARFEWFRDDDGVRLSGAPLRVGGPGGLGIMLPGGAADLAGNYYNVTLGANWTPRSRIVVRPEVRWDWSDGTTAAPFDGFTKDSQFTASVDAIITF
ncbi:MAG: porin [Pirellulaceae bacterium]|nr:porin [Pirellulaceae bacterium]